MLIYKYVIQPGAQVIETKGFCLRPRSVGVQGEDVVIWAEVCNDLPSKDR